MAKVGTRKRGDRWQYYFEGAKVNGKRKQIVKSGFRTKKEAYAEGVKALAEYEGGSSPKAPQTLSVNDYLDQWIGLYVDANLRLSTKRNYVNTINRNIRPRIGGYRLSSVTPAVVQGVLNELQKEGKSASYITLVRVVMRSAFAYAVNPLGYIKDNPAASAKTPKNTPKPKTRRVMSREEMDRILERFDGTGFRLPVLIAYHAGLRIGEVYGLTWDDIDLQAGTVSVRKQLKQYKRKWYFSEPKNDASIRTVLVGKTLVEALREELELQRAERADLGEYYQDTRNLVNAKRGGGFYTPNSFTYASRIIRFELGISDFDFHSIRHTHATMLIEAGANIKDVSARLGHSRVETTLQIYTHQTESMSEMTVDIFERLTAE
jgi:integrase|nr:MAG TPA: Integrase [Caudoviricetes sp.]